MANVWHGHVIGAIEVLVPIEISIKNTGTVARGPKLSDVVVDTGDTTKEFLAIEEEVAVMVEIVHINFKAAITKGAEKFIGNFVTDFGDKLKGGLDAEGVIEAQLE